MAVGRSRILLLLVLTATTSAHHWHALCKLNYACSSCALTLRTPIESIDDETRCTGLAAVASLEGTRAESRTMTPQAARQR